MAKALWTCSKNLMRKLLSLHPTGLLQSVVLALSLWLLGVAGGWAQTELIERVEVLEDPTAALTIDTIDMQAFTAGKPVFAAGFTNSAYWLRVHVRMVPGRTHVNLLVLPTTLDHISLLCRTQMRLDAGAKRGLVGVIRSGKSIGCLHSEVLRSPLPRMAGYTCCGFNPPVPFR